MPVIDIPNNLDYGPLEALVALRDDVDRRREQLRREIANALRVAANRIENPQLLPHADVPDTMDTVRESMILGRREIIRLGRARDSFETQRAALPPGGPV